MKHIPVVSVPSTERVGRSSIRLLAGSPTRRAALGLVGGGLALSCIPPAFAQRRAAQGPAEVSVEELMKPNPLGEVIVGRADAPVTIVEYASLTCSHCATFHIKVFPVLKEMLQRRGGDLSEASIQGRRLPPARRSCQHDRPRGLAEQPGQ